MKFTITREANHRIYLYSVRAIYGRTLFRASFLVSATGVVEMLDDAPLAELPQPLQRPFEPLAARERPLFDLLSSVAPGLKRPTSARFPGLLEPDPDLDRFTFFLEPDEASAVIAGRPAPPKAIQVFERIEPAPTPEAAEHYRRFAKLVEPCPLAPIPDLSAWAATLRAEFPWFEPVTAWLLRQLAVGLHGDGAFYCSPLLLLGAPGVGKTAYMGRMAELSGLPFRSLALAGQSDNRLLSGTARGWATGRPSLPVVSIADGGVANPLLLLDELDKAGGGDVNGRVHDTLLELLEPASARRFYDEYLCGHADLSRVSYVATANRADRLPSTLLSRFHVLRVDAPEPGHYPAIVRRTVAAFAARHGVHPAFIEPFDEPEWRWLGRQFHSPRRAKQATELLLGHRLLRPSRPEAVH